MAADQSTARVAADLRAVIANPNMPEPIRRELAAFISQGAYPTSHEGQQALYQVLAGTKYADAPGTLLPDLFQLPSVAGPTGTPGENQAGANGAPPAAAPSAGNNVPFYMRPTSGGTQGDNNGQNGAGPIGGAAPISVGNAVPQSGGINASNDPGIGGGGAAVQNTIAQQALNAAGQAAQFYNKSGGGQPPTGAGAGAATAAGAVGNTGSGFTPAQGMNLSTDDDRLIRFAMQQAGLNPDRLTSFSKSIGQQLVPLLRSARSAYGILNDNSVATMPDFFAKLAGSLTQKGGDFFNTLRQLGNDTAGSENFKNYLAGISNPEDQAAMIQSLMPSRFAGSNPLIQQSAADTFDRQLNAFKDNVFSNSGQVPNNGIFLDWLQGQNNVDPITRRIFGLK